MKKMLGLVVLTTVLTSLLFSSCGRREKESKEGSTIALILKTLNNPFFIDMERGAREAAAKLPI
ncbi:MAG: D-ribose ABC transporter substrate-binding protein, partial [Planctomycetota bacterium]